MLSVAFKCRLGSPNGQSWNEENEESSCIGLEVSDVVRGEILVAGKWSCLRGLEVGPAGWQRNIIG